MGIEDNDTQEILSELRNLRAALIPTRASVPPIQRKRTARQIEGALWLRPRDVEQAYGIDSTMLCRLCKSDDAAQRLHSVLIVGRTGKRGVRLVKRANLDAYLEKRKAT